MNKPFLFSGSFSGLIRVAFLWAVLLGIAASPIRALAQQDVATAEYLAKRHFEICNERDSVKRWELARATYAQDIRSVDPSLEAQGLRGMQTAIRQLHQMFPRALLSISGRVLAHHNVAKFAYILAEPGGPPIVTGTDILVLKDGLIHWIYTFPDQ
jgi:hypothetical protein